MNVAGSGYGSYFVLSMFDRLWRPDITREEGLEMMKKGIEEVKKRLVVAPPKYAVKVSLVSGMEGRGGEEAPREAREGVKKGGLNGTSGRYSRLFTDLLDTYNLSLCDCWVQMVDKRGITDMGMF
jgi:hypothetical protein